MCVAKMIKKVVLLVLAMFIGVSMHAEVATIVDGLSINKWRFHNGGEFPGAKGSVVENPQGGITLNHDFSNGGAYVGAYLLAYDIEKLNSFIVTLESNADTSISFRIIDGNSRAFQSVPVKINGTKEVTLDLNNQKWAGVWAQKGLTDPNITKMVFPLKTIMIMVNKGKNPQPNFLNIKKVSADIPPLEGLKLLSDCKTTKNFYFSDGGEFPGAKGGLFVANDKLNLKYDFTNGGQYVGAMYFCLNNIVVPEKVVFNIETNENITVSYRFVDANSRAYVSTHRKVPKGEHSLVLDLKHMPLLGSYGRKGVTNENIKSMVFPLKNIDFLIYNNNQVKTGNVIIKNVKFIELPMSSSEASNLELSGKFDADEMVTLSFDSKEDAFYLFQVTLGDRVIETGINCEMLIEAKKGANKHTFKLPKFLGANSHYTVRLLDFSSKKVIAETPLVVIPKQSAPLAFAIDSAKIINDGVKVEYSADKKAKGFAQLYLEIADKVYAVDQKELNFSNNEDFIKFSKEFLALAQNANAKIKVLVTPSKDNKVITLTPNFKTAKNKLPKPINYGVYEDRFGIWHAWYMNHLSQNIFDGANYVPVGGMWCPVLVTSAYHNTDDKIQKLYEQDLEVLNSIKAAGITDIYINSGMGTNQFQFYIDLLEANDIKYGWQFSSGSCTVVHEGMHTDSFYLKKDNLTKGVYKNGVIDFKLPFGQKALGFLIIPTNNLTKCFYVDYIDKKGSSEREQIFDLDKGKDLSATRVVTLREELPIKNGTSCIIIPKLKARMTHFNLWDPKWRTGIEELYRERLTNIDFGPNLRFIIDPIMNETHMLLDTENLRQYTKYINKDFGILLKQKYKNIQNLSKAWGGNIPSFEFAQNVVPQRFGDDILLLNAETGEVVKVKAKESTMIIDYNDMIRQSYSLHYNNFAKFIKSFVNIPIVSKVVGAHGSYLHTSTVYNGIDGVGFEVYLNQGQPQENSGGTCRAVADCATHTMWKVGTELGYSAAIGNGNQKCFPNEGTLRFLSDGLTSLGLSGYFFFGVALQPINFWGNHNFYDSPETMKWIRKAGDSYIAKRRAVTPKSYVFPFKPANLGRSNISRFSAVYDNTANDVLLSLKIKGNEWASLTSVLPKDEMDRIFISCEDLPYSKHYAKDITDAMKLADQVYYLGLRKDLGTIPAIDKYFTSKIITFPDSTKAQALKRVPNSEVLASHNGDIWAMKVGKIVIVSRTPIRFANNRGETSFRFLKPEWVKDINYFKNGDPIVLADINMSKMTLVNNKYAENQVPLHLEKRLVIPFDVMNMTTETKKFNLNVSVNNLAKLEKKSYSFTLKRGETKCVEIPVNLEEAFKHYKSCKLTISEANNEFTTQTINLSKRVAKYVHAVEKDKMSTAKWTNFDPKEWNAVNRVAGANPDISGRFRAAYTPEKIFIEVEVKDSMHVATTDIPALWEYDSIQMALSILKNDELFGGEYVELGVTNHKSGDKLFVYNALLSKKLGVLTDSTVKFSRKGDISRYFITLDVAELGLNKVTKNSGVGFSMLINSNNKTGRLGYLRFGDGIGETKDPLYFNFIRFL